MNALDFILIVPLLFMAYRGYSKGLIISLATLAALILGIWAGIRFSGAASGYVGQIIHADEKYLPAITFMVIFILILVVVHLFGKMLEKLADLVALGWINKLLGGLFGAAKAVLLLSVLLYLITTFDRNEKLITPGVKENSFLYQPVASIVPLLLPFFHLDKLKLNHLQEKDIIADSGFMPL
ncbi:MAG TPA: CvpA family protein [Bacteroidales bacterium]|nr:CvpA family protein [Bacteroidales bacterium]HNS47860.1 CvpA family protein [Bacteroidales bacterium]